jgi:hypothetical protein
VVMRNALWPSQVILFPRVFSMANPSANAGEFYSINAGKAGKQGSREVGK